MRHPRLYWKTTFFASLAGFWGGIAVVSFIIGGYSIWLMRQSGGMPDIAALTAFSQRFGRYAGPIATYMAAFGVSYWFSSTHRDASRWNAVLIGFWMTLFGLPILIIMPQPVPVAVWSYLRALGVYAGFALVGGELARRRMASARLYSNLLRALSAVAREEDLVRALGEHRPSGDITHIALWTPDPAGQDKALVLRGTWQASTASYIPERLDATTCPTLDRVDSRAPFPFRVRQLPVAEQHFWDQMGIRAGVIIPIVESDRTSAPWHGLLVVATAVQDALPSRVVRFYDALVPTLSLTLEKIHLLRRVSETAVLEERQRLAREIHDTLAQDFTSIVTHLEAAESALDTDPEVARTHLDRARRAAREGLTEARRLVWALRPDILTGTDLPGALKRVAHRWSEETGVTAHVTVTGTPRPLPADADVVLLRAAQEALHNVRKHARASRVDVTLTYLDDRVILDVQDDGVGFDPTHLDVAPGLGLRGMRERVEARGGHLIIESAPGEGTTVAVVLTC